MHGIVVKPHAYLFPSIYCALPNKQIKPFHVINNNPHIDQRAVLLNKKGCNRMYGEMTSSLSLSAETPEAIAKDVDAISRIHVLPLLLDVLCEITGMGFAAVARVSDVSWTVCAVRDKIHFGLKVADQLPPESTLCIESKRTGRAIVIGHASRDPRYSTHQATKLQGVESYISFPILLSNGRYFGNLCTIDPAPANVSAPAITTTFKRFAEVIAGQLTGAGQSNSSAIRNEAEWVDTDPDINIAMVGLESRVRATSVKHSIGNFGTFPNQTDRLALESLLMQRVGELHSHLGRYDMYALTIQNWLKRRGDTDCDPLGKRANARTRGQSIVARLHSLKATERIIAEFEGINRQMISVLDRQEIVAKKEAAISCLQGVRSLWLQPVFTSKRAWFDHTGASAEELLNFIAAMERDISIVASLYMQLAEWTRRLSAARFRH